MGAYQERRPVPDGSWIYSNWFDNDLLNYFGECSTLAYLSDKKKLSPFNNRSDLFALVFICIFGFVNDPIDLFRSDSCDAGTATFTVSLSSRRLGPPLVSKIK